MNKIYFLALLFFLLFSCNNINKYDENFQSYYYKTFNRNIGVTNDLYIFLPMNACSSCIDRIIEHLAKNKNTNQIHLIFVYQSQAFFNIKKEYLKNYDMVLDKKLQAIEQGLIDGFNPVLIEYKKNRLVEITEVEVNKNWEESVKIIDKYF